MANRISCPQCRKELRFGAAAGRGVNIACPVCKATFAAASTPTHTGESVASSRRSGLLAVLMVSALAALALVGFVWPGFLRTGGLSAVARANQEQARNLLAFVPANSTAVLGVNFGDVRKSPDLQGAWTKLRERLAQWNDIPPVVHELIGDADTALLAGSGGGDATPVCIVRTEHPIDVARVKAAVGAGPAQRHHGVAICLCTPFMGKTVGLALPSEQIALLGLMPAEALGLQVASATQPNIHPDLRAQVEQVSTSVIWGAVQFDDAAKQGLRQLEDKLGIVFLLFPEAKAIAPLAQRGKGAVITLDAVANKKLKLSIGFTCHDANDAALLRAAVLNLWTSRGKDLLELVAAFGDKSGGNRLGKLLAEVSQTFDLEQRDTSVLLSVEVNHATLEELLNAGIVPGIG